MGVWLDKGPQCHAHPREQGKDKTSVRKPDRVSEARYFSHYYDNLPSSENIREERSIWVGVLNYGVSGRESMVNPIVVETCG